MCHDHVTVENHWSRQWTGSKELVKCVKKCCVWQAVWAGWGHASENPKLPELLHKNNISFIGPSEKAMWALGDKIASNFVAQTAEVPTLPWSGSGEINVCYVNNSVTCKMCLIVTCFSHADLATNHYSDMYVCWDTFVLHVWN